MGGCWGNRERWWRSNARSVLVGNQALLSVLLAERFLSKAGYGDTSLP